MSMQQPPPTDHPPTPFLHKFPVEVWDECWSHSDVEDLQDLSVACQLFRSLCQPRIFRHQHFWAPDPEEVRRDNWANDARYLVRSASRFVHLANSKQRQMVQAWDFYGSFELDLRDEFSDIPNIDLVLQTYLCAKETFVLTLPFFTNLRSLTIYNIKVDVPLLNNLSLLQYLDFLYLDHCTMTDQIGHLMSLRTFRVDRYVWIDATPSLSLLHLLSPISLEKLDLNSYEDVPRFLPALLADGTLGNLAHLRLCLPASMLDIFFDFLRACPNLQSLSILNHPDVANRRDSLHSDTVPFLNVYEGPLSLAGLFVGGRPVHTVRLKNHGGRVYSEGSVDMPSLSSTLSRMSNATVVLRCLRLPPLVPSPEAFHTVTDLFPHLHNLTMTFICHTSDMVPISYDLGDDSDTSDSEGDGEEHESTDTSAAVSPPVFSHIPAEDPRNADPPLDSFEVATVALDGEGLPIRPPDSFTGLMDWIATGHCPLPISLEHLDIQCRSGRGDLYIRPLSLPEQRGVAINLAKACPSLQEFILGSYDNVWKRFRNTWKEPRQKQKWF